MTNLPLSWKVSFYPKREPSKQSSKVDGFFLKNYDDNPIMADPGPNHHNDHPTPAATTRDVLTECLEAARKSLLSVGSGDGSQQQAIVQQGVKNLLVTFYDTKHQLLRKYPHAKSTLEYLEQHCTHPPQFGIDATKIDQYNSTRRHRHQVIQGGDTSSPIHDDCAPFDLIFFTFPHTGIPNNDPRSIASNQQLLRGFLKAATSLLKEGGEIQITLKKGEHYDQWKLPELLRNDVGITLESTHPLDKSLFPGYKHRLTNGMKGRITEVPDKKGAQVHVFRSSSFSSSTSLTKTLFAGKILTIVESPVAMDTGLPGPASSSSEWTDEELWTEVVVVLESFCAPANILELRRLLEPQPDTRQLNRVIYAMEKAKIVQRHAPTSKSQKPRWSLV